MAVYNADTVFNKKGKPATVSLDWNCGRINFSCNAVRLLGLKEGMRVTFETKENEPDLIYFYEDAKGIPLKLYGVHWEGVSLSIFCRPLSRILLSHFKLKKNTTFDVTAQTINLQDRLKPVWFIDKWKKHEPVKWRKVHGYW